MGRIYVPLDDLARFGYGEADLLAGVADDRFRAVMSFEAERAQTLLEQGRPLSRRLPGRVGLAVSLFTAGGLAALDRLAAARLRHPVELGARSQATPRVGGGARGRARRRAAAGATARGGAVTAVLAESMAIRYCETVTRSEARNFWYGIRLLPATKRRLLAAVYAMARRIDDVADGDLPPLEKRAALDADRSFARDRRVGLHRPGAWPPCTRPSESARCRCRRSAT